MDNFSFHIQLYIILIKISTYLLKNILRYVKLIIEKIERRDPTMNRVIFNENPLHTNICSRWVSERLISNLINNKNYETTSRNTSLS